MVIFKPKLNIYKHKSRRNFLKKLHKKLKSPLLKRPLMKNQAFSALKLRIKLIKKKSTSKKKHKNKR